MATISVVSCCRMILRKLLLRKAATIAAISLFLVAIFMLHLSLQQVPEQEPWRPSTPAAAAATVHTLSTATAAISSRSTDSAATNITSTTTLQLSTQTGKTRPLQCMEDAAGTADIQMSAVLDELPFDDIDGGAWKQGYTITPDTSRYSPSAPLTVFVMPHSHCDPGWLRTVEDYYNRQTRNILTYMTTALLQDRRRRFIWAEISFLSMWWAEQSEQRKDDFRMLVREGRLEIVTGGWVMNDEANTHYYAMVDQLIEGNLWVQRELGVTPKSGWAIDPFGYSPTMAYLLKRAGFSNMFIQRLHYSVKKMFSQRRWLEFGWRQLWDKDGTTDMFCHATPFYSYDIPHTCGPDPKICCQFDFIRAAGSKYNCPWKINPQPITDSNARDRVSMLVDQYRKKAHLYRTRFLIVPLGDDFRYDAEKEVRLQFSNYQRIIDYVDAHPELNVKIKFGTLSDYFDAIRADSASSDPAHPAVPSGFPTLSGDFYTYSDKAQEYWSGYYTSRPFTKHMNRVLEGTLRAAEILLSLTIAHHHYLPQHTSLLGEMVRARRELALFQHHDGITGTAKEAVVRDYISRLVRGVATGQRIIAAATQSLLLGDRAGETGDIILQVDRHYPNTDSVLVHHKLSLVGGASVRVTVVNPVGYQRTVLVKLRVDTPDVKVIDAVSESTLTSQLSPVWVGPCDIATGEYELIFPATLSPLGIHGYQILTSASDHAVQASVFTINCPDTITSPVFTVQSRTSGGGPIELQSPSITATFSSNTGLLQSLQPTGQPAALNMAVDIVQYGALTGAARSGAYLFLPDRDAASIISRQTGRVGVVSGHLVQGVRAVYDVVTTTVELHSEAVSSHGVSIVNTVDIRALSNKEVAMRVRSGVANSNGVFFTDLNGYQLQRRRTMSKLPTQGNYYPMPTVAMMEDESYRLSLLSDHSAGVASLRQGWLETMMDRRLMQDDYRGLGQPLKDNKKIELSYHLLLEPRPQTHPPSGANQAFQSLLAHTLSDLLIYPPISLLPTVTSTLLDHLSPSLSLLTHPLPCGVHLLNLRSLDNRESGLILHHRGVACSYQTTPTFTCSLPEDNMLALSSMFSGVEISSADEVSLSLLHKLRPLSQSTSYSTHLNPMEIQSYHITWS